MSKPDLTILNDEAVDLLKKMIAIPSFSKEEDKVATLIEQYFSDKKLESQRHLNNVWVKNKYFDNSKPTILLNSHFDTVKPNKAYSLDPFSPIEKDGKLFGLGSSDAGAALVSLISVFRYFCNKKDLKYNLIVAASAEEEISGKDGIESLLPLLGKIDCGIVGEPTQMQMAVAERGLLVLDCIAHGKAGHAARNEGENAIYKAIRDIEWFRTYNFAKHSEVLGEVKMSVTVINAGSQHNVVPDECRFTVDIRINELYTLEEIIGIIRVNVDCDIQPRSTRIRSTFIPMNHPLVIAGLNLGRTYYGSPTTSDKALMNFSALKVGPGDSARSHTADEYIVIDEIKEGIELYVKLLEQLL